MKPRDIIFVLAIVSTIAEVGILVSLRKIAKNTTPIAVVADDTEHQPIVIVERPYPGNK